MGHSLQKLSTGNLSDNAVFNNRFVVEICEKVHLHYRNLRLLLSLPDFIEIAKGMVAALDRWEKLGNPEPDKGQHVELCRKKVANVAYNEGIKVNLNKNLYNANKDQIYAEGANFGEEVYIHLKIRDLRLELSVKEFKELADAIAKAKTGLENSDIGALLQTP